MIKYSSFSCSPHFFYFILFILFHPIVRYPLKYQENTVNVISSDPPCKMAMPDSQLHPLKLCLIKYGSVTFCQVQIHLVHFRQVQIRLVQVRLDNILPR